MKSVQPGVGLLERRQGRVEPGLVAVRPRLELLPQRVEVDVLEELPERVQARGGDEILEDSEAVQALGPPELPTRDVLEKRYLAPLAGSLAGLAPRLRPGCPRRCRSE